MKKKVLQVNAGSGNFGGVSNFLYNVYKNIDRNKFIFDFLSPHETTYSTVRDEIEKLSGTVIELGVRYSKFYYFDIYRKLKSFLKTNKYDIVHINSGILTFNLITAMAAKSAKVKKIIVHSHNAIKPKNKIDEFFINIKKKMLKHYATNFLTCSNLAAQCMFSKDTKVKLIKNGIETDKFKFNIETRNKYRNSFNLKDNQLAICNIARFRHAKNHIYLLKIFEELLKREKNIVLFLIGEGELKHPIEILAREYGIIDNIRFLSVRKDISNIMSAMDVFVLPSVHEGLPLTGIEAQTNGLTCLFSDTITKEVGLTNICKFIGISEKDVNKWVEEILNVKPVANREGFCDIVKNNEYDIKQTALELENIYLN